MKKILTLSGLTILFFISMFTSGCISGNMGMSAGGDLIWWCDKCQCQVGNPKTHLCGKTKYDPVTKKDVPIDDAASNEIEKLLREDQESRNQNNAIAPLNKNVTRKKWQFWKKKSSPNNTNEEISNKREVRQPYWEEKNKTIDDSDAQPANKKKKWKFWQK